MENSWETKKANAYIFYTSTYLAKEPPFISLCIIYLSKSNSQVLYNTILTVSSMAQSISRWCASSEFILEEKLKSGKGRSFLNLFVCWTGRNKNRFHRASVVVSNLSEKAFYIPPLLYSSKVYCTCTMIILKEEVDLNILSCSAVGTQ